MGSKARSSPGSTSGAGNVAADTLAACADFRPAAVARRSAEGLW